MSPLSHLIRLILFWSFLYLVGKSFAEVDSFQWQWDASGELAVSWNVHASNSSAPYTYPSSQLQWSADLSRWEGFGVIHTPADSDVAVLTLSDKITLNETTMRGFFRVVSFSSTSGTDYTDQDFSRTNVAGYNFNGADLSTTKFAATSTGAYTLTQLGGTQIPELPYYADTEQFDRLSQNTLLLRLIASVTVSELNELLATHGGSITGSVTATASPLVAVRFPNGSDLSTIKAALVALPFVMEAVQDIAVRPMILPEPPSGIPTTPAPYWEWNEPGEPDGNWGLEWARIPQMWNFDDAIARLESLRPDTMRMFPTTILHDAGFADSHWDIDCAEISDPLPFRDEVHGTQIAGILAAEWELGGMEGLDPHIDLASLATPMTQFAALKAIAWLAENEEPRIINQSFAIAWDGENPNAHPEIQEALDMQAEWLVDLLDTLFRQDKAPFIVVAAGNDGIDSQWAGAAQRAARAKDSRHILVVGAQNRNLPQAADFSNTNVEILAPGTEILSTVPDEKYDWITGTSAAAPHVAGVAGYLVHLNPFLTNDDLKRILMKGDRVGIEIPDVTPIEVLDAFAAALTIDKVRPAAEGTMLRMLLDIDDGSVDGNTRVFLPGVDELEEQLEDDRSFDIPDGEENGQTEVEDFDEDGAPGDGVIDMADFRRWRDWLLVGETHGLNGDSDHGKHDANRDGEVEPEDETSLYPRGDFNGDGKVDRDSTYVVNGLLEDEGPLTDLEVLTKSGYWSDPDYDVTELPDLIDSVDLLISAQHLITTKAPEMMSGVVTLYDAATDEAIPEVKEVTLDSENLSHRYTIPVGKEYYVASEPIEITDDDDHTVKVRMQSIDSQETTAADVGADYVVDLTKVERTTKIFRNEDVEIIESDPVEEEVEAKLPEENGEPYLHAWANDEGTFFVIAQSAADHQHEIPPRPNETFRSFVRWQRSFEKDDDAGNFTFEVKPLILELGEGINNREEMIASAEIRVERRYYGGSGEWETVFHTMAKVKGQSFPNSQHTYRLEEHEGDVEASPLEIHFTILELQDGSTRTIYGGCCYRQETYEGTVPLDDIDEGETFEIRYTLEAEAFAATSIDGESARAEIGDPLDYGGVTMEYGDFGEKFGIGSVTPDGSGGVTVSHRSSPKFYFQLLDGAGQVTAMALGATGQGTLRAPASDDYRLISIPISRPRDVDGDGMDDVYELNHATILDPLDPADAQEDPDGDGLANVAEYQRGTDPTVFDEVTTPDSPALYPGIVVDASGTHMADLNNDGSWDFINGPLRQVAMGNPDGSFQDSTELPLDYLNGKLKLAFVNEDAFVDIVASETFKNVVTVLLGNGDGSFTAQPTFEVGGLIESITIRDFNADGRQDLLVTDLQSTNVFFMAQDTTGNFALDQTVAASSRVSQSDLGDVNADGVLDLIAARSSRSMIEVFLGQSSGGFGEATELAGGGSDVAIADLNGDGSDDLVALDGFSHRMFVFLSQGDGSFGEATVHETGTRPSAVQLADLTGDGHLEVVVAHADSSYHLVFQGDGAGAFGEPSIVATAKSTELTLVDWNADSHLDIVTSLPRGQSVINLGNGDGSFDSREQIEFETWVSTIAAANVDGDPELEIIGRRDSSIDVWKHGLSSGGRPHLLSSTSLPEGAFIMVAANVNNDAFSDVLVLTKEDAWSPNATNALHAFVSDGAGGLSAFLEMPLDEVPRGLHVAELSGDAFPDLVIEVEAEESDLSNTFYEIQTYLNEGDGTYTSSTVVSPSSKTSTTGIRDVDGDGIDEVLVQSLNGSWQIEIAARNAADGSWTRRPSPSEPPSPSSIAWYRGGMLTPKTNADGQLEIYHWPIVNGAFGESELLHTTNGRHAGQLVVADVNGDGHEDLLSTVLGGLTHLFLATGEDSWSAEPINVHTAGAVIQPLDLNRDGKMDLLGWERFKTGVSLVLQK